MADNLDKTLIVLLAETTRHMLTLWEVLHSNSVVAKARRGCDVQKYRRSMTDEGDVYTFESYVEAETRNGEVFCWAVDIARGSWGWELQRDVSKQFKDGAHVVKDFDTHRFASVIDLASKHADLMVEFAKSADDFDFSQ